MNLLQRVNCILGRHQRDPHRVRVGEVVDRGHCIGCDRRMVKDMQGWRMAD